MNRTVYSVTVILLSLSLLAACSQQQKPASHPVINKNISESKEIMSAAPIAQKEEIHSLFPEEAPARIIDKINNTSSIRAKLQTEQGMLLVKSKGPEEIGHLDAPSTYGVEGDLTFQSNYSLVYQQDEKEHVVKELPALTFIQPTDEPVGFHKIPFKAVDVYLLTPQYKGPHGYSFYAVGILKKNGNVIPLTFVDQNGKSDSYNYHSPKFMPYNQQERLVIKPGVSAGSDVIENVSFRLDVQKGEFIAQ